MALVISKEVETQVIEDRKAGLSLDALVTKYTEQGVTKNWVRRVTKGVEVVKEETSPQKAIVKILPLAVRPVGAKPSEYFHILKEAYGTEWDEGQGYERLNMTSGQKSYVKSQVKEKAAKQGLVAYFVPEWLDTKEPEQCNKLMLTLAQSLYDSIESQISCFFEAYPELGEKRGGGYSVRQELFALVVNGYAPEGINKRCERNLEAVEFLSGKADLPLPSPARIAAYLDRLHKEALLHKDDPRTTIDPVELERRRAVVAAITKPAVPMKETEKNLESYEALIESMGY